MYLTTWRDKVFKKEMRNEQNEMFKVLRPLVNFTIHLIFKYMLMIIKQNQEDQGEFSISSWTFEAM